MEGSAFNPNFRQNVYRTEGAVVSVGEVMSIHALTVSGAPTPLRLRRWFAVLDPHRADYRAPRRASH